MKTLTAKWFETTVRHEQDENEKGNRRSQTNDTLVVDAATFGEAEKLALEQVASDYPGEVEVTRMSVAPYTSILIPEGEQTEQESHFYHARVVYILIDERTGRERETLSHVLAQGTDIGNARTNINETYANSLLDYEIKSIAETNISGIITTNDE